MLMLFPGHQSTLEVWDREGSTMFMLNWNRKDRQEGRWRSLPHVWRALFYGTDTSLTELESGSGKSSATKVGILPQTTQKGQKNGLTLL